MKILKVTIAASALAANLAFASIVDNGLNGNIQTDSWGMLGGLDGTSASTWTNNISAQTSADTNASLSKTSGGHYSATMGLYSWGGDSVLRITSGNPLNNANSVVFNIRTNSTHDSIANLHIGSNSYAPSASNSVIGESYESSFGTLTPTFTSYQWDLNGLGVNQTSDIVDLYVEFTAANHLSITGLQLDQSDVYNVASTVVPVPAAAWLFGSALLGLTVIKRK